MLQPMEEPIQLFGTWCAGAEGGPAGTKRLGRRRGGCAAPGSFILKGSDSALGPTPQRPLLTFRSLVMAQTTPTPTETCMIPFSDVGGSTSDQELPTRPQKTAQAAPSASVPGRRWAPSPRTRVRLPTFGIVPVDSFPDQRLPLPQRDPQEVVGPTADLDRLPRGIHERP